MTTDEIRELVAKDMVSHWKVSHLEAALLEAAERIDDLEQRLEHIANFLHPARPGDGAVALAREASRR